MDSTMIVLIYQMKIIAVLMCIGLFVQKLKLFDDNLIDSLSGIIAKLILPLMLITIIGSLSKKELLSGINILIATAILYTVSVLSAKFLSRFSKIEEPERSMHVLLQCYGNSGYIGIPLITSIFSAQAGIVAAAYTTVDSFFYWIVAPAITGQEKMNLKRLISPITLSVLTGLLIVILNFNFNGNIVWDTMKDVGGTCKYFASIYIGACIGRMGFAKLKLHLRSVTASIARLILIPLGAYFLFGKTQFLSGDYLVMFIILSATPSGMSLPIVANISGIKNNEYISAGVTLSTILCLISIPFIVWAIGRI